MKKILLAGLPFLLLAGRAHALTEEVETYEYGKTFSAIASTAGVVYAGQCSRDKFRVYEWKVWEGNYSVRAYVQPVANITIRRENTDGILEDMDVFKDRAIQAATQAGGNMVCLIALKKSKQELGIEKMIFRAYRQLYTGSEQIQGSLDSFYADMKKGAPITLQDLGRTPETAGGEINTPSREEIQ